MKTWFLAFRSGLIFVFVLSLPLSALADTVYYFNPHFIITDDEMIDYQSLSLNQIEVFLAEQGSALSNLVLPDSEGDLRQAATIIWKASQDYQINPRVILATLQKEQSLINDPAPTQNQINKAMGYRCPDGGSCAPQAATFGKQVDGAAWQFRQYMDTPQRWNFTAGQTYQIDDFFISPINQATAGLYNYTPHYSGNKRFWALWLKYWGKNYPDGSLLKTAADPNVWVVQYGVRRLVTSWGAFISRFNPNKILVVSQTDLEKYEKGLPIKFYNHSLLRLPNGKTYFLVNDTLRLIESSEVFRSIGFNPEEVEDIDFGDVGGLTIGQPITLETAYPAGALLQDNTTGGVYYVIDGIKQPIVAPEIIKANFGNRLLTSISAEELVQYQTGEPVKFKDGELIKAKDDSKVYVVADGQRQWLKTQAAFDKFGYKWDNIIITSKQAVEIHPLGSDLE